jgi:hypothetical protein
MMLKKRGCLRLKTGKEDATNILYLKQLPLVGAAHRVALATRVLGARTPKALAYEFDFIFMSEI